MKHKLLVNVKYGKPRYLSKQQPATKKCTRAGKNEFIRKSAWCPFCVLYCNLYHGRMKGLGQQQLYCTRISHKCINGRLKQLLFPLSPLPLLFILESSSLNFSFYTLTKYSSHCWFFLLSFSDLSLYNIKSRVIHTDGTFVTACDGWWMKE